MFLLGMLHGFSPLLEKCLHHEACLLYTSDAADERSSVDLGGRRIIKKKKTEDGGRWRRIKNKRTNQAQRTQCRQ